MTTKSPSAGPSLTLPIDRRVLNPLAAACLAIAVLTAPAAAQWTRIADVQESDITSVWASGDTIAAGADTAAYVSTNGGVTWKRSARVGAGVTSINAVWVRNGRLYAGTSGQGVFVSDDLGTTWLGFSQGLVGGFADTQLSIRDLLVRGDSLYAATDDGTWVRNLAGAGTWIKFGNAFGINQASAMLGIAGNDTRLVAAAGFNGQAFIRDRGDVDWTNTWLNDIGPQPGLAPLSIAWTGLRWVMGTNIGVLISDSGNPPWTPAGPDPGLVFFMPLVVRDHELFAAFGMGLTSLLEFSANDGATWQEVETRTNTGVYRLAISGSDLYAGQIDGLWRRSIANLSVPDSSPSAILQFAIAGPQPIGDQVRFRFDLPEPGPIALEVFDVAGRRAAEPIRGEWPAGSHELEWDARALSPGVYLARLTAGGSRSTVRMIRAR